MDLPLNAFKARRPRQTTTDRTVVCPHEILQRSCQRHEEVIRRIAKGGKAPPGILTPDEAAARRYIERGSVFAAVGLDINILARESGKLAGRFRG